MSTDHRFMPSSEVHEPKHISTSTTADAGKVITPSFSTNGESVLRFLTPEDVGIKQYYQEWGVTQNSTTISTTAASDPQLYTASDYIVLNSTNLPGATEDETNGITWNSTNYLVTMPVDGVYRTEFWANVVSDTNNTKVGFRFSKNSTAESSVVKHDIPAVGRVINISATYLSNLNAGDTVGMAIATDKTVNLTIKDIKVTFTLLREL